MVGRQVAREDEITKEIGKQQLGMLEENHKSKEK